MSVTFDVPRVGAPLAPFPDLEGSVPSCDAVEDLQIPSESIKYSASNVQLAINDSVIGAGMFHLSNKKVYWLEVLDSNNSTASHAAAECGPHFRGREPLSIAFTYQSIGLHAICRDTDAWPRSCLYCQLDGIDDKVLRLGGVDLPPLDVTAAKEIDGDTSTANGSEKSDNNEDDDDGNLIDGMPKMTELRFVPSGNDESALTQMFKIFSEMSSLNPDPPTLEEDNINNNPLMAPFGGVDTEWFTADNLNEWRPEYSDELASCDEDDDDDDKVLEDPKE